MKPNRFVTRLTSTALAIPLVACTLVACTTPEDIAASDESFATDTLRYPITWAPDDIDWDIEPVVWRLEDTSLWSVQDLIDLSTWDELLAGVSKSFVQFHTDELDGSPRNTAVEVTVKVLEVPYDTLVQRLPARDWGINLAHYLGGEAQVYAVDNQGRALRQVERMVLSPFPCDFESDLTNNDMTKVEVLSYGDTNTKVFWKVTHSDNHSTEMDVGFVEFDAIDAQQTLVAFHSAHRINALGGLHIPSLLLAPALSDTFLDHVNRYEAIVE